MMRQDYDFLVKGSTDPGLNWRAVDRPYHLRRATFGPSKWPV